MKKVTIDREVYEKLVNTLAQLPYAQVAGLLAEASQSAQLVQDEPVTETDEDDNAG